MADFVGQCAGVLDAAERERLVIRKRPQRAADLALDLAHHKGGNGKSQRDGNRVPAGQVLGKILSRFAKLVLQRAAAALHGQGGLGSRLGNDFDHVLAISPQLDVEPVFQDLSGKIYRLFSFLLVGEI